MIEQNKIRFGIEQLHIAFLENDEYGEIHHVPGAIGFGVTPEGGETAIPADNIKYFVSTTNDGYVGDIETVLIPDEILAEMLGWYFDENDVLIEDAEGRAKEFALMGQIQGDRRNRRFVYYRVLAARPGESARTKGDTIDHQPENLSITVLPTAFEDKKINRAVVEYSEATKEIYNNFFNAVYFPGDSPVSANKERLENVIALAGKLESDDYTEDSWQAVSAALITANAVESDVNATQAQVNKATRDLQQAISWLEVTQ